MISRSAGGAGSSAGTIVRQLYAANGGTEPEADAFARHVEADQRIEIARMQGLLAACAEAPSR